MSKEWTSVKDDLPDPDEFYLVLYEIYGMKYITEMLRQSDGWRNPHGSLILDYSKTITHWMVRPDDPIDQPVEAVTNE